MPSAQHDPYAEGKSPKTIKSHLEFDLIARRMASDAADLVAPTEVPPEVPEDVAPAQPQPPEPGSAEALQAKMQGILRRVGVITRQEIEQGELDLALPEDPHRSLGGGRETLENLGNVPVIGEFRETVTRGRGGKPIVRIELNERFLDVPVQETPSPGQSQAAEVEKAKEILRSGGGRSVKSLRRRTG